MSRLPPIVDTKSTSPSGVKTGLTLRWALSDIGTGSPPPARTTQTVDGARFPTLSPMKNCWLPVEKATSWSSEDHDGIMTPSPLGGPATFRGFSPFAPVITRADVIGLMHAARSPLLEKTQPSSLSKPE